ncbi:MAG TPA: hypothetical protein VEF05_17150 [Terriglobales bacterium]|nr:hypothetical protein [Terriglobales bacterium]
MSTEHHTHGPTPNGSPVHQDVSFEPRDVRTSPILKFLVYLGITIVISYVITLGIYRGLNRYWTATYPQPMPARMEAGPTMPPEPRLQGLPGHLTDPQQDLRDKLKADTEANNKLSWIDEKAGIAEIPVEDAMRLIVEKGLPAVTPPPAEKK